MCAAYPPVRKRLYADLAVELHYSSLPKLDSRQTDELQPTLSSVTLPVGDTDAHTINSMVGNTHIVLCLKPRLQGISAA